MGASTACDRCGKQDVDLLGWLCESCYHQFDNCEQPLTFADRVFLAALLRSFMDRSPGREWVQAFDILKKLERRAE